jgi:hypothetical protein
MVMMQARFSTDEWTGLPLDLIRFCWDQSEKLIDARHLRIKKLPSLFYSDLLEKAYFKMCLVWTHEIRLHEVKDSETEGKTAGEEAESPVHRFSY